MTQPFDLKEAIRQQAELHNPAKAVKNKLADLRRRGKRKSLVNWRTTSLLDQPLNYTPENRREAKRDKLMEKARNECGTKSKKRRWLQQAWREAEAADRINQRGPLSPIKLGQSRQERRKARRLAAPMKGAGGPKTYQARKEIEARVYAESVRLWNAQPPESREKLRYIQDRVARQHGVTWRRYA